MDWLTSNGVLNDCDGGYRFTAKKTFASGCLADNLLVMSGQYNHPSAGPEVLHFSVPREAVTLRRPCGEYHAVWNLILKAALPLICAAYVGIAESAAEKALVSARGKRDDGVTPLLIGEMQNDLTCAQIALQNMIENASDLDVEPGIAHANRSLICKTLVTESVKRTADKALETTGGSGYFRKLGLERIVRDAYAAQFHPMHAKKQHRFTGRLAILLLFR